MRYATFRTGFTLIEVMIAVLLVGIAIASLVAANSALTKANGAGTEMSIAEFLAEQIRELTAMLPVSDPGSTTWSTFGPETAETLTGAFAYDDLDDFDNFDSTTIGAPIDSQRNPLNQFAAYRQVVTVENVSANNFEAVVSDRSSSFVRVTVRILLNSREICSISWLRTKY
jgi:prepilin-type N-terminal cleavage/methylation domain-containing protein